MNSKLARAYERYHARVVAQLALGLIEKLPPARYMERYGMLSLCYRHEDGKLAGVVKPINSGLRYVGMARTEPKSHRHRGQGPLTTEVGGWFTNDSGEYTKKGEGLCWGTLWRLPGKGCMSRYVAGYCFGDGGMHTIDLGRIFNATPLDHIENGYPDGLWEAAAYADSLAEAAAEAEREYQREQEEIDRADDADELDA